MSPTSKKVNQRPKESSDRQSADNTGKPGHLQRLRGVFSSSSVKNKQEASSGEYISGESGNDIDDNLIGEAHTRQSTEAVPEGQRRNSQPELSESPGDFNSEEQSSEQAAKRLRSKQSPLMQQGGLINGGEDSLGVVNNISARKNMQNSHPTNNVQDMGSFKTILFQRVKSHFPRFTEEALTPQTRSFVVFLVEESYRLLSGEIDTLTTAKRDLSHLLETTVEDLAQQQEQCRALIRRAKENAQKMRISDENAANLEEQLSNLQEAHLKEQQEQSNHFEQLLQDHEKMANQKDQEFERMRSDHVVELEALKANLREQKTRNQKVDQMRQRSETKVAQLTQEHEATLSRLSQEQKAKEAQLIQDHAVALSQLSQKQKTREAQLTTEHTRKMNSLSKELQNSCVALFARDDNAYTASLFNVVIKREPDEQIKARFLDVVQLVDDLGRLMWKHDRKIWTDQELYKLGTNHNQRLLKKSILQDTIWTILLKYVYCSPFRVFGEEGEILEKEWNKQCDQGLS
ncbi:hypothetical protein H2198_001041 [Neophaeococcomyces mojaviensis]|uniref:Uncharacterized protein n=1 Tax=Neophaeococcomyces mojaviensis TaxID=3383035 RepID=A0ACC3AIQ3_9EURO|nr:hypothetical protein H2198_001041 [Knufia sp. JES_112]